MKNLVESLKIKPIRKECFIYILYNFKTFFVVKIGPDMNFVAFVTGSDLLSRSVARQTSCGIIVCLFGLFQNYVSCYPLFM